MCLFQSLLNTLIDSALIVLLFLLCRRQSIAGKLGVIHYAAFGATRGVWSPQKSRGHLS